MARWKSWKHVAMVTLVIAPAVLPGCEEQDPNAGSDSVSSAPQTKSSEWRSGNQTYQTAVTDEEDDAALQAAIAEARATAEQARLLWSESPPEQRKSWAVKWAAPTIDAGTEHVWVYPIHWSPFRIEGTLAAAPRAELESGKILGELVSFPIQELSDWIFLLEDDFDGAFEGGFTVKVLAERFGQPAGVPMSRGTDSP